MYIYENYGKIVTMEKLFEQYRRLIQHTELNVTRSLEGQISWDARLIGIKGSRGTGKTTLLLQHIKKTFADNLKTALYVSLDNLWFFNNTLTDLADYFVKHGGMYLFLDEVHKYPSWDREIKNLYDGYPELHIVFTGSSLLEILAARVDLSRRALVYVLPGLSFREFLEIKTGEKFPVLELQDILKHHEKLAEDIVKKTKPLVFFNDYLNYGYYPFFLEGEKDYFQRLGEIVLMILEQELPLMKMIEPAYVPKVKQLLAIISQSVPFIPNISKLSERIGINRQTFLTYLQYLQQAKLILLLYKEGSGISTLQRPDKIFLDNTSLMYLLGENHPNIGNLRETFLANQLSMKHSIRYSEKSDFLVDDTYTIEVGGKNKNGKQLDGLIHAYIAADDIEFGFGNKIPLWLFGCMY